jgi:RHS repeat-associated protein
VNYTGRQYDSDSGLYCYRSRSYSPLLGCFITRDPLPLLASYDFTLNDTWINLYNYTTNRPVNRLDPFGELDCGCKYSDYACCRFAENAGLDLPSGHQVQSSVVCCQGHYVICNYVPGGAEPSYSKTANDIFDECVNAHEASHIPDLVPCPHDCLDVSQSHFPLSLFGAFGDQSECRAWKEQTQCLFHNIAIGRCEGEPQCERRLHDAYVSVAGEARRVCNKWTNFGVN